MGVNNWNLNIVERGLARTSDQTPEPVTSDQTPEDWEVNFAEDSGEQFLVYLASESERINNSTVSTVTKGLQTDSCCKENGERGLEVSCDIIRVLCLSCQHQLHHSRSALSAKFW